MPTTLAAAEPFNIEAMDICQLRRFYRLATVSTTGFARLVFPTRPNGFVESVATLAILAQWRVRELSSTTDHDREYFRSLWESGFTALPEYARWK
jgi:hypothetical protein